MTSCFPRPLILGAVVLSLAMGGCGKERKPRYTAVAVVGYPYPFGTDVKRLMGNDTWEPKPLNCPSYVEYSLRNPLSQSRWSGFDFVYVTADSAGKLQGFSAGRTFTTVSEAQAAIFDLLGEIRRRYGSPTDSSLVQGTLTLTRQWRDTTGNMIAVEEPNGGAKKNAERVGRAWMIHSVSAKLRKECHQPFVD